MSQFTPDAFAVSVLKRIGAPTSRQNMKAMRAWIAQEGGHWHNQAHYNPLNTTQPAAGAGNTGSQGNIKVYRSPQQGIQATVKTLENGNYGNIVAALRQGQSAEAVARAIESSPWGTKHINTLGSASSAPAKSSSVDTSNVSVSGGIMDFQATQTPATEQPSRTAAVQMVLQHRGGKLPKLGSGGSRLAQADYLYKSGLATERVPGSYSSKITTTPTKVRPADPMANSMKVKGAHFKIEGPNPGRVKPEVVSFAKQVAAQAGFGLVATDGSTHSKMTVNGNVSEHWTGNAVDIFKTADGTLMKGTVLTHAGQAALIAAGMPAKEARKHKGGLFNVGNHQIIFNTMEGGNHYDHLHISTHAAR